MDAIFELYRLYYDYKYLFLAWIKLLFYIDLHKLYELHFTLEVKQK